jgi:hypothetical protein
VPVLIGVATVLFAFSGNVRGWIVRHGEDPALHSARADRIGLVLLAPVSVYAGYFGAGTSIMLLAILSLGPASDFRSVNALKNLLSGSRASSRSSSSSSPAWSSGRRRSRW